MVREQPTTLNIRLEALRTDGGTQPRAEVQAALVAEYAEEMLGGAVFPPVVVFFDGESYWLADGFHRVDAARYAGLVELPAEVRQGTRRDAVLFSVGANAGHGLRRTKEDKERAVKTLLDDAEWSGKSERWIADMARVSPKTVARIKRDCGFPQSGQREGRDGRIIDTANIGRRPESPLIAYETPYETPEEAAERVARGRARLEAWAEEQGLEPLPEPAPFRLIEPASEKLPAYITLDQWKALAEAKQATLLEVLPSGKTFNRQDNRAIEWAQWSWNPVTGCRHDCPYCYARDIANRFYEQKFEPSFLPDRLRAPWNTPVPPQAAQDVAFKNVFTCSMADLFGRWVPREWIEAVLSVVRANPQWNFLFLTKFPKRYCEFEFPANAWLGTTVDCQARVKNAEDAFAKVTGGTRWLSVEPMLEPLKFTRLKLFNWVVIGGASASSQTPAWVPPIDWIANLHQQARGAGCRIYYKDNCGMADALRIREFPWSDPTPRELPDSFRYLAGL